MAVPEQTPFIEYTANGTTTVFPVPFQCDKAEYLIVNLDGNEAPVGSWSFVNGSITFNTAPANGVLITIERNTPFRRTTEYQSYNNSFRPSSVNKEFDLIWWKLQELGYRDQVIWLALLKEIADRTSADSEMLDYILNQDNTLKADYISRDAVLKDYIDQMIALVTGDPSFTGIKAQFVLSDGGKNQQEINDSFEFKKTTLEAKTLKEMVLVFSKIDMNQDETITTTPVKSTSNKSFRSNRHVLTQTTQGKSNIIADYNQNNVSVDGFHFIQDKTLPIGGGVLNDHHMVRVYGGEFCRILNSLFDGQYGVSLAYKSDVFTDRRGLFGLIAFNDATDIEGMFIENGGSSFNRIIGNALNSASRGEQMACRFTAYNSGNDPTQILALADGIVCTGNVYRNIASGHSYQNATKLSCSSAIHFEDMDRAIHATRGQSAVTGTFYPANDPMLHMIFFTSGKCKKIIANLSMNHSMFDTASDGSALTETGIEELTGRVGTGFNQYRGVIYDAKATGALFRYSHNLYNLQIDKSTGDGVVVSGDYGGGTLIVNACNTGVNITGNNNNLTVVSTGNVFNGMAVSGSNNTINIQTDGNVIVSGNGNTIIGRIGGNLTLVNGSTNGANNKFIGEVVGTVTRGTGSGNDYTGLKGWAGVEVMGVPTPITTTSNGRITVTVPKHTSAQVRTARPTIPSNASSYKGECISISGASVIFEFRDSSGAVLNAVPLVFNYEYKCS
ncbi:phage tail fiber protein [Acinetobacter baumannii]|uniref:phage tail fiber protein n=1 Tax=Acinetobacter baumannii TaxID=470 RepID=UPI003B4379A9